MPARDRDVEALAASLAAASLTPKGPHASLEAMLALVPRLARMPIAGDGNCACASPKMKSACHCGSGASWIDTRTLARLADHAAAACLDEATLRALGLVLLLELLMYDAHRAHLFHQPIERRAVRALAYLLALLDDSLDGGCAAHVVIRHERTLHVAQGA